MAGRLRTLEEVSKAAEDAGINTSTKGPVQVVSFTTNPMSDEYRLLELPDKILQTLQVGKSVVIRGDHQDEAVLCTDDATFDLKMADTSNTLLLCPGCVCPSDSEFSSSQSPLIHTEVCSCHSSYYELKLCRPRLHKLKHLLQADLYRGPEYDETESGEKRKHTFTDLLGSVQASVSQLQEYLGSLGALCINGYWQLLDPDFRDRVMVRILTLLEEKGWSYDCVPGDECCEILSELEPRVVLKHCLDFYGEKIDMEGTESSTGSHYKLSEDKICQFYAEYLLRPAGRFNFQEFMESWQQSLPEGMTAREDHLAGLALTDLNGIPPIIWHFPVSSLPEDPHARFSKLFKTKPKWTFAEIQPYISDLESPGQSLNALLLKYTRSSKDATGVKVYNAK